jgi:hypothetical protein
MKEQGGEQGGDGGRGRREDIVREGGEDMERWMPWKLLNSNSDSL